MAGQELDNATIPVGRRWWTSLGAHGALVVGGVIIAVHVIVLVLDAVLAPGMDYDAQARSARLVSIAATVLPLVGTCFLWVGELIRRGRWGGPSGYRPDAVLPQGTNTVEVRMLSLRWLVLWFVVAAVIAGGLAVAAGTDLASDRMAPWTLNGILAAAVAATVLGSIVKRTAWSRGGRERAATVAAGVAELHPALVARGEVTPAGGRTFWRWFSYRWRLDLWVCALGGIAAWVAGWAASGIGTSSDAGEVTLVFGVVAAVLLGLGLWTTTQFWRAGEDLAHAESVA